MDAKPTRSKYLAAAALCLLFAVIIAVNIFPVFRNFSYLGAMDWDQFCFFTLLPCISYARDFELPFWTPYEAGGREIWSHPHSPALSPFFPLFIIFGIIKGYKVLLALHLFIGLWGMYALCGRLGMKPLSRIGAGILFLFSSYIPIHYAAGNDVDTTPAVFFPFALYFFLRFAAEKKLKYGALSALSMLVMFLEGGFYGFIHFMMLFMVYTLAKAAFDKNPKILKYALLVFALILLLGEIKIVPSILFNRNFPRQDPKYDIGPTLNMSLPDILYRRFLEKNQTHYQDISRKFLWVAHSGYIGLLPVCLLLFIIAYKPGRFPAEKTAAAVFFILSLENNTFISRHMWYLLRQFPVFDSMRHLTDTLFPALFFMSVLFGRALDEIASIAGNRKMARYLPLVIVLITFADLRGLNNKVYSAAFPVPPLPAPAEIKPFKQAIPPIFTAEKDKVIGRMYYNALYDNYGQLNSYTNVIGSRRATPYEDPGYRGEVYLLYNTGTLQAYRIKSGSVSAKVSVNSYDRLIINQNYSRHWKIKGVKGAKTVNEGGLLAVNLGSGTHDITLYYFPDYTAALAGLTLITAVCIFIRRNKEI